MTESKVEVLSDAEIEFLNKIEKTFLLSSRELDFLLKVKPLCCCVCGRIPSQTEKNVRIEFTCGDVLCKEHYLILKKNNRVCDLLSKEQKK